MKRRASLAVTVARGQRVQSTHDTCRQNDLATVYFEKTRWAMVVGKSDTRIAIRVAGFAVKDKLVVPSKVQRVR